jgi:hypothetical protein
MTYAKNRMIALGLATVLATGATVSSLAAAPIANAAALTSASGNVIQVQGHGHSGRAARAHRYAYPDGYGYADPDAYGYAYPNAWGYAYPNAYGYAYPDADAYSFPFGNAYGYSGAPSYGGSVNSYDCLGGRDGDGVPCGGGY